MIKHFLFVWLFYWSLVFLLPATSTYSAVTFAFALQLLFVFFVIVGYSWSGINLNARKLFQWNQQAPRNTDWMIRALLWLSFIGTVSLIYDKIVIQGIDYTQGIAVAREAWREKGIARDGGISSIYSILGYLLSSGYFVAAVLLLLGGKAINTKKRYKILLAIFMLLIVNSAITGGRSNVLLLLVFILGTMTTVSGFSYKELFANRFLRLLMLFILFFSFSYVLYVFSERANATGIEASAYLKQFLPYLGLELNTSFIEFMGSGIISNLLSLLVLSASYLSHSFATTAAIMEYGTGDKIILFTHFMNILHKLQLVDRLDSSWFLTGRFPSLPGALFYQFGAFGFAVTSVFIGFLSGLSKCFYLYKPSSIIFLMFYLIMYSVLIVSPLGLAIDFMSFPFVILSFLLISFLNLLLNFMRKYI